MRCRTAFALLLTGALVAGCSSGSHQSSAPPAPTATGASTAATSSTATSSTAPSPATSSPPTTSGAAPDAGGTVWLCQPLRANDPCATDQSSTTVAPDLQLTVVHGPAAPTALQPVDCFYIYPTVSTQTTPNSDLTVEPAEIKAAQAQVSRFSSVCNVWAPMYRQRTLNGLASSPAEAVASSQIALASLLAAWHDYVATENDGRPIVILGHSQGAAFAINLLQQQFDNDPAMRAKLVSAVVLGGNVQVPTGHDVGGSFQNIPACRATDQTGCVIAFSSFPSPPPADALFGVAGQGVSLQSGQTTKAGQQVLCTNPADLAASTSVAPLDPFLWIADRPSRAVLPTDWVEFRDLYTGQCLNTADASWLQVTDVGGEADRRTRLTEPSGPAWGFHEFDFNIALGDLVRDLHAQIAAYLAAHPR